MYLCINTQQSVPVQPAPSNKQTRHVFFNHTIYENRATLQSAQLSQKTSCRMAYLTCSLLDFQFGSVNAKNVLQWAFFHIETCEYLILLTLRRKISRNNEICLQLFYLYMFHLLSIFISKCKMHEHNIHRPLNVGPCPVLNVQYMYCFQHLGSKILYSDCETFSQCKVGRCEVGLKNVSGTCKFSLVEEDYAASSLGTERGNSYGNTTA